MYSFWTFFIRKRSFSSLLMAALIIFGALSVLAISKESTPEVQVPVGIVTTILPGASAESVEQLITNKVEQRLSSDLEQLKKLTSSSREGVSTVVAEFEASANLEKSIRDLKDAVDTVEPELPSEAEDPFVSEVDFVDQPIMTITVASDVPAEYFISVAEQIENEIESIQGISRVEVSGNRERETQVIVHKEALNSFGLRLTDIVGAIRNSNSNLPIGSINLDTISYNVVFEGDITDPREIEDIAILTSGGEPIFIRDVATVIDGLEEATSFSRVSIEGQPSQPALSFAVYKQTGGDITQIARTVREKVDELKKDGNILAGTETLILYDTGQLIEEDLTNLALTGLQTVILVMLALFVAIGWRESILAGLAIPLSFLVAFIGLETSGNTINFVSLFSLILAVGILVDSAIVMVEGIHTRMKEGGDKIQAAIETIKEYHWPLTSGTLTTVAAFAPLFIVSGVTGEFIASIPFTIIFVLIASLIVALGFLPVIGSKFLRRRSTSGLEEKQEVYSRKLQTWYQGVLRSILGNKKRENIFIASIILAFFIAVSFPVVGIVQVIFFPQEDSEYIFIDVQLSEGSTLGVTDLETRKVEEFLYDIPEIASFLTTVGQGSPYGAGGSGGQLGNIQVTLSDDRDRGSTEVMEAMRVALSGVHSSTVRVFQPNAGPPTGDPVAIKILGDNFAELDELALDVENILEEIPGTSDVTSSSKSGGTEFVLTVDRAKATELGLNPSVIAQTLRTALEGSTATTINQPEDDIDVVVKLNLNTQYRDAHDTNTITIDEVRNLEVETPEGRVLLGSVLETSIRKSNAVINHEDRKRVVTVSSGLTADSTTLQVITAFNDRRAGLSIPTGVEIAVGGENEEIDQSFRDMGYALLLSLVLMLSILVLQFNSYRHAFYVISIVPFSLIGIFVGLALTGKALSFPSIMGFIALSGIVVNNSIILIDVINKLRRRSPDTSLQEVVIEGATSRLRPILLTTITTVIGIFPLTYTAEIWAPLAYAIMFGLAFSVVITLIFIPIIYNRWPGQVKS